MNLYLGVLSLKIRLSKLHTSMKPLPKLPLSPEESWGKDSCLLKNKHLEVTKELASSKLCLEEQELGTGESKALWVTSLHAGQGLLEHTFCFYSMLSVDT